MTAISKKATVAGITTLNVSDIKPNTFNPRKTFSENDLRELAESIKQVGVLHPIVVRPKGKKFEIVCGERRFRASALAEIKTIPAIIRELTDDESMELSITENLQRTDISPVEETVAYKRLVDTGRYDVASLSVRFGKSEGYIRNRLKLNDLTEDILSLVNSDVIPVSIALELCKYSTEIQTDVYERHLTGSPNSLYTDWRNLKTGDFIKQLEGSYCNDLSRYHFDKTACAKCPFNTNCYSLFVDGSREGKCTNRHCLTEKNKLHLVDTCKTIIKENPTMEICQSTYMLNINDDVYLELSKQGYSIIEDHVQSFPKEPQKPKREDFETESDFETANDTYCSQFTDYVEEREKIGHLLSEGKAKRTVAVSNNKAYAGYILLPESSENAGGDETDLLEKLEKQDRRNKEIAVEKIVDDTKQLIRDTEIPLMDFTEFEDKLLYFVMLSDLKKEHVSLFSKDPDKWHLTEEEKISAINSLTEEQRTIIRRDYLVKHLSDTIGTAKKSFLMLEFARLHFPEQLAETENKYNEVYTKRHERIVEKMEALQKDALEVA
jgi:ParB family chromosome partitioning protein